MSIVGRVAGSAARRLGNKARRFSPTAAANAARAPYQARINRLNSRRATGNRASNRAVRAGTGGRGFKQHVSNEKMLLESRKLGRRMDIAGTSAYNQQVKRNIKTGALVGAGIMLYPNTGQTGPNQNTFARRGMQSRRTVGISSGSLQGIQRASSMYGSIGSM